MTPSSTRKAAVSMGAPPFPSMSRALSNHVASRRADDAPYGRGHPGLPGERAAQQRAYADAPCAHEGEDTCQRPARPRETKPGHG